VPEGRAVDAPAISLDLTATALAAAAARPAPGKPLDGVNLLPHVAGTVGTPPHEILFWRYGEFAAVRRGNDKLHVSRNGPAKLYDLAADPAETTDVAAQRPQVVREMSAALAAWDAQLVPPKWGGVPARGRRERMREGVAGEEEPG
jgi:arylsulfatase A-like enzyme